MNSIKKLSVLFAAVGLAFAASAASSVYWASVYTGAYDSNTGIEKASSYSAYLCTTKAASTLGGTTVDDLTTALSSDYTAWGTEFSGATTTGTGDITSLTAVDYGQNQFGFTQYFSQALASGDYLAVVLYQDKTASEYAVQVLGNVQTFNDNNLVFDSAYTTSGTVGSWTAASIPEPTSALLMLFGLAGLALKRRA